ncbi:hypothetical protein SDC9_211596 [bioreactor metagenome]|uniref:Uncharacterized protein n=1 Tax=bioreactor metagenome TaxID=1076179 RepID=A0A645JL40_9ZZZZ
MHHDSAPDELGTGQAEHFVHNFVERKRLEREWAALQQSAQPPDDIARTTVRRDNVGQDTLHLSHIRRILGQEMLGRLGVAAHGNALRMRQHAVQPFVALGQRLGM